MSNVIDFSKFKEDMEEDDFLLELEQLANDIERDNIEKLRMVYASGIQAIDAGMGLDDIMNAMDMTHELYFPDIEE